MYLLFVLSGASSSMAKIKAWSNYIVPHFWYCSNVCKTTETTSDEGALRITKVVVKLGKDVPLQGLVYVQIFLCFLETIFSVKSCCQIQIHVFSSLQAGFGVGRGVVPLKAVL